ncbi:type IV toxin-antitoxin system AbiEi family antitoxin domain-containing protein [Demequina soli]|uniref:type IV toxin-antitoxin system AbiEi family antitoxin domain-containing protein n=1 Tax=Demequina soli TaxID=1638987 RepID=UPI00078306E0|nr:type IV toxin-antitoxin system AbiEi family antitoxin domain-containing protein [Demequina soli]
MDPIRELQSRKGVARFLDLVEARVPMSRVREGVAAGRIVRPHRGVYALPDADPVDVAAVSFRADPCCLSVLTRAQLPVVPRNTVPHLLLPNDRSLARPGLRTLDDAVFHRCDLYPSAQMGRVPVAVDLASRCLQRPGLLAAVDAALRAGTLTRDQIRGFRVAPTADREWLVTHADARSESPMESLTRAALIDAGIGFAIQVPIEGVGRVDFVVERRLVIECDGFAFHSDPESHRRDLERANALMMRGIPQLHYAWNDVWKQPDEIIADVRAMLWRIGAA